MAEPIPAADPALLAAQAKAGQAGVDAYHAAQTELSRQRETAVQQAMQEAAMRGAPTGAMSSIAPQMTAPYDQRIASLGQASAGFQADMAARDRRMVDYNSAVGAARSYIPQQAELVAAPIRANADFQVRQTQMRGEQAISEIESNTRLTEARMRAAAQAAAIKAANEAAKEAKALKPPTLTKTELEAQLASRAAQTLGVSTQTVRDLIQANLTEIASTMTQSEKAIRGDTEAENERANRARVNDQTAATYIARGIAEYQRSNPAAAAAMRAGVSGAAAQQAPGPVATFPTMGPFGSTGSFTIKPPGTVTMQDPSSARQAERQAEALRQAQETVRQLQENTRQSMQRQGRQQYDISRQLGSAQRIAEAPFRSTDEQGRLMAMLSPAQLSMFSEFDRNMIAGSAAHGGLRSPQDVDYLLSGSSTGNRGIGSPYAADVLQAAMRQAAGGLIEEGGYDIDPSEIENAIGTAESYRPGMSLSELVRAQTGQPSAAQEFDYATQDQEAAIEAEEDFLADQERSAQDRADEDAAIDEALADANEEGARIAFNTKYGFNPPSRFGSPLDVALLVQSGEFKSAENMLREFVDPETGGIEDIDDALSQIPISTPGVRGLLREIYGMVSE